MTKTRKATRIRQVFKLFPMQSYKHKTTRPLIPSKEEAGMEDGNETVGRKTTSELPLNPVVTRGQDPELFWMHKYGPEDDQTTKEIDIRSLYRHEHISPELLLNKLYRQVQDAPKAGHQLGLFAPDVRDLFGNTLDLDEFDKVGEYYRHQGDWSNRLIQGDSLLSMTSLLEREGFAGNPLKYYGEIRVDCEGGGKEQKGTGQRQSHSPVRQRCEPLRQ